MNRLETIASHNKVLFKTLRIYEWNIVQIYFHMHKLDEYSEKLRKFWFSANKIVNNLLTICKYIP